MKIFESLTSGHCRSGGILIKQMSTKTESCHKRSGTLSLMDRVSQHPSEQIPECHNFEISKTVHCWRILEFLGNSFTPEGKSCGQENSQAVVIVAIEGSVDVEAILYSQIGRAHV